MVSGREKEGNSKGDNSQDMKMAERFLKVILNEPYI